MERLEDRQCPSVVLLVSNEPNNNVERFDGTTGQLIDTFVTSGSGGLQSPRGLAYGPDGNLYVSKNTTPGSVLRYDGTTGAFLNSFAVGGGLSAAHGLVFGPDGNFYVCGLFNAAVLRYDGMTGDFIDDFASGGGLSLPHDLTFGPDGNLYVTSIGTNSVKRYNGTTGAFMDDFVAPQSGGLYGPRGLVFGPDGNLYVSEQFGSQRILRYDGHTGNFIDVFIPTGSGGLAQPIGLAFGPDGNLYVSSNNGTGQILRYDGTTGAFIDVFASEQESAGPTFILFHDTSGVPSFRVSAPSSVQAGTPFDVTVTAEDSNGHQAYGYTGTVHFTSADPYGATLPDDCTFTAADQGQHSFTGETTLYTTGTRDITVTDTATGVTGSALVEVASAPATSLAVTAPDTVTAGMPFDVTVTAVDPYGNTDANYQGTVTFSTTDPDPGVMLPANYPFTGNDAGVHTFPGGATLETVGTWDITAMDLANGLTGTATVTVTNPPGPHRNTFGGRICWWVVRPDRGSGGRRPFLSGINCRARRRCAPGSGSYTAARVGRAIRNRAWSACPKGSPFLPTANRHAPAGLRCCIRGVQRSPCELVGRGLGALRGFPAVGKQVPPAVTKDRHRPGMVPALGLRAGTSSPRVYRRPSLTRRFP
jgi:DNA-binding beta-propeller fold protein YncE